MRTGHLLQLRILGLACIVCLGLTVSAYASKAGDLPKICRNNFKENDCIGDECVNIREQPCFYGDCKESGYCSCHPCWSGQFCNETDNIHPPIFGDSQYDAIIPSDTQTGVPFLFVTASDGDRPRCGWSIDSTDCYCADVHFSIKSTAVRDKLVSPKLDIHPLTGGIFLAEDGLLETGLSEYEIFVENPDGLRGSSVFLTVFVEDIYDWGGVFKSRQLRAVPDTSGLNAQNSDRLDYSLAVAAVDQGIVTITPGDRISIEFTVTIPVNYYVEDVAMEIFTDDVNGTFAVLCEPVVTPGANVEMDTSVPEMEYNTGYLLSADTAIINIGTVTNRGGSADAGADDILVTFDITVIDDPTIADGGIYWVTAGIEHYQTSRIWVGQLGFTVDLVAEPIPPTTAQIDGQVSVPVGEPHIFSFDIQTYKRKTDLTAMISTADANHNSICRMELCSAGSGFCLDISRAEATYTRGNASVSSWGHNIDATVPLGVIVYGGDLSDPVGSLFSLDVVVYVSESAELAGLQTLNGEVTEDGVNTATPLATYTPAAIRTYKSAGHSVGVTATTSCVGNPCELATGETVHFEVMLTVPSGATITPVTVAFQSDLLPDGSPVMGSCSGSSIVNFYQIDDDIACLGAWIDRADLKVEDLPTGPQLNLGGVTNLNYSGQENATIRLGAVLSFSPNAAPATTYNLDIVVTAGGDVTTESFPVSQAADPLALPTLEASDPTPAAFEYALVYPVDSIDIPPGGFSVVKVEFTPEPATQCSYSVSVGANSTNLRLLDFEVTYIGKGFKCGDVTRGNTQGVKGDISPGDGATLYSTANIDFNVIVAPRWTDTPATADDKIIVEATVQLSDDRSAVVDGSLHSIAVSALMCTTRLWVAEGDVRANYSSTYPIVSPISNDLYFESPVVDTVTPGVASTLRHNITLNETSCLTYALNYTTTQEWMRIKDVDFVFVGSNFPGLKLDNITLDTGDTYAYLDLGTVCNTLREAATMADEEDMSFSVELSVEFANTSEIDRGSWGELMATLVIGNGEDTPIESVAHVTFKADTPKTTFELSCPTSSNSMNISEVEQCNLIINMIDEDLDLQLEAETILNITATLHIVEATVMSIGRNIVPTTLNVGDQLSLSSGDNTTQNTKAYADVGTLRNTFTHTNISGTYVSGDNDIVIRFPVQMTDAWSNELGSNPRLEIGAAAGTYMIWVCSQEFTVARDGKERPMLDVGYSLTSSSEDLQVGDPVVYGVNISHNKLSTAEPINLQIRLYLPTYINFTNFVNENENDKLPAPTYEVSAGSVTLTCDRLFFSDSIYFSIDATIDSSFVFRDKSLWHATTPLQVAYQMTDRVGSAYVADEYMAEDTQFVTFNFTATPVPSGPLPPACPSPAALGMEDGSIKDCQITASFQPDISRSAHHARLNNAGWKTEARGGRFLEGRLLKVDLGRLVTLTAIDTQGGETGDIGSFDLLYSTNDALYKKAVPMDEFNHRKSNPASGTILSDEIVRHTLLNPVEARYIVLQLTDYPFSSVNRLYNMLRLEFYGCAAGPIQTDVCPSQGTALHEYDRGFVVAGETLYVCDSKSHLDSGLMRSIDANTFAFNWIKPTMQCYVTLDGRTWDAMPAKIHSIVGYSPSENDALYAIFEDSPGYTIGENFGSSWIAIPTAEYESAALDPTFVPFVSVPFISEADFAVQTVQDYQATFDGMSRQFSGVWEPILNWNGCCTSVCKLDGINSC